MAAKFAGSDPGIEIAGLSDPGLKRSHNEDRLGFDAELGIAVLADGMGGHRAGEVASRMAVDSVLGSLRKQLSGKKRGSLTGSQFLQCISHTIFDSNAEIFEAASRDPERRGMGTTLVAAVLGESMLYVGHVGDSRLYRLRNHQLDRITRDHSLVQDLVDKGFYTEDQARDASVKHVVTRALGAAREVEVDTLEVEARQGDLFLLCSDGLTDMLSDGEILRFLDSQPQHLQQLAETLVQQANANGGKDNITVILMRHRV